MRVVVIVGNELCRQLLERFPGELNAAERIENDMNPLALIGGYSPFAAFHQNDPSAYFSFRVNRAGKTSGKRSASQRSRSNRRKR